MNKKGNIILFLIFLFLVTIVFSLVLLHKEGIESHYSNIDLKFEGKVYDKSFNDFTRGILHLNLTKSTVDEYDIRDNSSIYLCVIKNGKADLITSGLERVEVGDIIKVDAKKKEILFVRNKDIYFRRSTKMSNALGSFYFYRKLHKL